MSEIKELICIGCPLGCPLTVEMEQKEVLSVTGNTCANGDRYARTVTSTVIVEGGEQAVVSVKTALDIPKNKIFDCMAELAKIKISAPVAIGDVVVKNIADTGVSVVATRAVAKQMR